MSNKSRDIETIDNIINSAIPFKDSMFISSRTRICLDVIKILRDHIVFLYEHSDKQDLLITMYEDILRQDIKHLKSENRTLDSIVKDLKEIINNENPPSKEIN